MTVDTKLTTTIHAYNFDVSKPEDAKAWHELCNRLNRESPPIMEAMGNFYHQVKDLDGQQIELETEYLFDNQWNTAPMNGGNGLRVFDWALDYLEIKSIKRGHYLDQTPAMAEIRQNTLKCGYCGRQEHVLKAMLFCPHCLDSEFLKEEDLYLLRMQPVNSRERRSPLTQAERDYLLPQYTQAQIHGSSERGKARIAKQREDILHKAEVTISDAVDERDGLLWLLDRGLSIENVIYYKHTHKFSFGWRSPVSAEVRSKLLDLLTEFPYDYEIKGG